jgi:hypothetical protein
LLVAVRRTSLALAVAAGLALSGVAVEAMAAPKVKPKTMNSSTTTTTMKKGSTTTTTRH